MEEQSTYSEDYKQTEIPAFHLEDFSTETETLLNGYSTAREAYLSLKQEYRANQSEMRESFITAKTEFFSLQYKLFGNKDLANHGLITPSEQDIIFFGAGTNEQYLTTCIDVEFRIINWYYDNLERLEAEGAQTQKEDPVLLQTETETDLVTDQEKEKDLPPRDKESRERLARNFPEAKVILDALLFDPAISQKTNAPELLMQLAFMNYIDNKKVSEFNNLYNPLIKNPAFRNTFERLIEISHDIPPAFSQNMTNILRQEAETNLPEQDEKTGEDMISLQRLLKYYVYKEVPAVYHTIANTRTNTQGLYANLEAFSPDSISQWEVLPNNAPEKLKFFGVLHAIRADTVTSKNLFKLSRLLFYADFQRSPRVHQLHELNKNLDGYIQDEKKRQELSRILEYQIKLEEARTLQQSEEMQFVESDTPQQTEIPLEKFQLAYQVLYARLTMKQLEPLDVLHTSRIQALFLTRYKPEKTTVASAVSKALKMYENKQTEFIAFMSKLQPQDIQEVRRLHRIESGSELRQAILAALKSSDRTGIRILWRKHPQIQGVNTLRGLFPEAQVSSLERTLVTETFPLEPVYREMITQANAALPKIEQSVATAGPREVDSAKEQEDTVEALTPEKFVTKYKFFAGQIIDRAPLILALMSRKDTQGLDALLHNMISSSHGDHTAFVDNLFRTMKKFFPAESNSPKAALFRDYWKKVSSQDNIRYDKYFQQVTRRKGHFLLEEEPAEIKGQIYLTAAVFVEVMGQMIGENVKDRPLLTAGSGFSTSTLMGEEERHLQIDKPLENRALLPVLQTGNITDNNIYQIDKELAGARNLKTNDHYLNRLQRLSIEVKWKLHILRQYEQRSNEYFAEIDPGLNNLVAGPNGFEDQLFLFNLIAGIGDKKNLIHADPQITQLYRDLVEDFIREFKPTGPDKEPVEERGYMNRVNYNDNGGEAMFALYNQEVAEEKKLAEQQGHKRTLGQSLRLVLKYGALFRYRTDYLDSPNRLQLFLKGIELYDLVRQVDQYVEIKTRGLNPNSPRLQAFSQKVLAAGQLRLESPAHPGAPGNVSIKEERPGNYIESPSSSSGSSTNQKRGVTTAPAPLPPSLEISPSIRRNLPALRTSVLETLGIDPDSWTGEQITDSTKHTDWASGFTAREQGDQNMLLLTKAIERVSYLGQPAYSFAVDPERRAIVMVYYSPDIEKELRVASGVALPNGSRGITAAKVFGVDSETPPSEGGWMQTNAVMLRSQEKALADVGRTKGERHFYIINQEGGQAITSSFDSYDRTYSGDPNTFWEHPLKEMRMVVLKSMDASLKEESRMIYGGKIEELVPYYSQQLGLDDDTRRILVVKTEEEIKTHQYPDLRALVEGYKTLLRSGTREQDLSESVEQRYPDYSIDVYSVPDRQQMHLGNILSDPENLHSQLYQVKAVIAPGSYRLSEVSGYLHPEQNPRDRRSVTCYELAYKSHVQRIYHDPETGMSFMQWPGMNFTPENSTVKPYMRILLSGEKAIQKANQELAQR